MKLVRFKRHYGCLFIIGLAFITSTISCKQDRSKLAEQYCDCLEKHQHLTVEEQLDNCKEVLGDVVEWDDTEQQIAEKFRGIDSLLKQGCSHYSEILNSFSFTNGEWVDLKEEKATELLDSECLDFKDYANFYYLESTGDTTHLKIMNNLWMDNFQNGKYFSYLQMTWLSPCEFQLEFVESTEPNRKDMFKKGDVFLYRIINRKENYFLMMVSYEDLKQEFKLYVDE